MQSIIFLTNEFMQMIKSSGMSLDCLKSDQIGNYLSREDQYDIDYMTTKAREDGNILSYYGFGFETDADKQLAKSKIVMPKDNLDKYVAGLMSIETPIDAYCPDSNTIILWIDDSAIEEKSYRMFHANLRRVLRAMTRVMSYDTVLKTSQFELAILRD